MEAAIWASAAIRPIRTETNPGALTTQGAANLGSLSLRRRGLLTPCAHRAKEHGVPKSCAVPRAGADPIGAAVLDRASRVAGGVCGARRGRGRSSPAASRYCRDTNTEVRRLIGEIGGQEVTSRASGSAIVSPITMQLLTLLSTKAARIHFMLKPGISRRTRSTPGCSEPPLARGGRSACATAKRSMPRTSDAA